MTAGASGRLARIATVIVLTSGTTGCGPGAPRGVAARAGDIEIMAPVVAAPPGQAVAAAYLTINNTGRGPDTLVAVTSPLAKSGSIHRQRAEGGLSQMEPVTTLEILPGETMALAPGGTHLMLERLAVRPQPGDTVELRLDFQRAGPVVVRAPVRGYADIDREVRP